jgi:pimeloyl-ACP methyl ester carboxylesterase
VVSATLADPGWNNSTVLNGDVVDEVSKLKHTVKGEIRVYASSQLVQTLIEHDLVDELRLAIFPLMMGAGNRLFDQTSDPKPLRAKHLRLVDTHTVGDSLAYLTIRVSARCLSQTGAAWEPVAAELCRRGHAVHTPTIAGHGPAARMHLTHADAVASLVAYLREHELSDVVLVGHSIAGSFIAKAAEQAPELIKRLVFQGAIAAADGNALADEFPPEDAALFGMADAAQGFLLPFEVVRERACNDTDLATANAIYAGMSPIPAAYFTDKLDLKVFYDLIGRGEIKTSYVHPVNDFALPPGEYSSFPRFAQRLGPLCRILQLQGAHYVMVTRASELADTLIRAARD